MDRVRRLQQFWNWLPAFRAVGESQHLPTAASELGVSAPALSRTVKQLESSLEMSLFQRASQRIELNHAGQLLLHYVRDAMRLIDDGLQAVEDSTFRGPMRIAASYSVQLSHLLPAFEILLAEHPDLVPDVAPVDVASAFQLLKNGALDAVFLEDPEADEELTVERLDGIVYGVYASPTHPLAITPPDDLAECGNHRWVVPHGVATYDGWPPDIPRVIGMRVASLGVAIEACAAYGLLAHMPDDVGRRYPNLLRRVMGSGTARGLFVARRPKLGDHRDRTTATIDAVRQVAAERARNRV